MERIEDAVKKAGRDILLSAHHKQTKYDIQHGNMSVRQHTINVAICSMLISEKLGISCDKRRSSEAPCCMITFCMTGMIKIMPIFSDCMGYIIRELH